MKLQLLEDMHDIKIMNARDTVASWEINQINTDIIKPQLIADIDECSENVIQILK